MAKGSISFNFGANRKPKKPKAAKGKKGSGKRSNAWQAYAGKSP